MKNKEFECLVEMLSQYEYPHQIKFFRLYFDYGMEYHEDFSIFQKFHRIVTKNSLELEIDGRNGFDLFDGILYDSNRALKFLPEVSQEILECNFQ